MNQTEELSEPEAIEALADCVQQIWNNLPHFSIHSQSSITHNNFYISTDELLWTDGFWAGELLLAFEASHDQSYQIACQNNMEKFLIRIEDDYLSENEIPGLTYYPSCVRAYNVLEDLDGKDAALLAARKIVQLVQEIQIDYKKPESLMNIPLLMWASEKNENEFYSTAKRIAFDTIKYSAENTIPEIAWKLYGISLAMKYFHQSEFLEKFRELVSVYFSSEEASDITDTSSASIICCALFEAVKILKAADGIKFETEINSYLHKAACILKTLVYDFAVQSPRNSNGLLYTLEDGKEICTFWGDYFYMEALTRFIKPSWHL